jgi:hypothetical protein
MHLPILERSVVAHHRLTAERWNIGLASFHVLCDDIPIHSGHVLVEEHQIDRMQGEQL